MHKSILVVAFDAEWEVSLSDLLNGVNLEIPSEEHLDRHLVDETRELVGILVVGDHNLGKLTQVRRNYPHLRVVFLTHKQGPSGNPIPNLLVVPMGQGGDLEGQIREFFGLSST